MEQSSIQKVDSYLKGRSIECSNQMISRIIQLRKYRYPVFKWFSFQRPINQILTVVNILGTGTKYTDLESKYKTWFLNKSSHHFLPLCFENFGIKSLMKLNIEKVIFF